MLSIQLYGSFVFSKPLHGSQMNARRTEADAEPSDSTCEIHKEPTYIDTWTAGSSCYTACKDSSKMISVETLYSNSSLKPLH